MQKDRRCCSIARDKLFPVITLLRNKCKRDEFFNNKLMSLTSPAVDFSTMTEEELSTILWKEDTKLKIKIIYIVAEYALDFIIKTLCSQ
jgi:hypothetical protein